MSRRRARSAEWQKHGCSSWTAMSSKAWRCSTRLGWRRSPGTSIRSRPGSSTASSYAPCRDLGSTTWPRNGPRRWSGGAGRMPSGACTGAAVSTARRSSGCAGHAARQRPRPSSACEELRPYLRREMGWPLSELGRIRFRRGDIEGAEDAFLAAHRAGWDPQPGLALVRLAQGDAAAAAASIRDALEHPMRVPFKERPPDTDLQRAPLLEAQVEIEIAAGDIARARSAADELTRVAARFAEQGAGRRRDPCSRKGAARGGRSGGRGAVLRRSRAALERGRGARTRRRWRGPVSPTPCARAAVTTGPPWSSKRPARCSTGSRPSRQPTTRCRSSLTAERRSSGHRRQHVSPGGRLLVGGLRGAHGASARPQGHPVPRAVARRPWP